MLKADKEIDDVPLRKFYNDCIHPEVMDTSLNMIWEHLAAGDVLDVFQFSTGVGLAIAKKLKPKNPAEMTAANAMMRLMSEKDKESQQDRYVRIQKNGLDVFEREMQVNGLNKEQRELMHKHCDKYWGCCAIQEQMMEILMDIAHFTLGEANAARKVVAKKQMSKIPDLKRQVYDKLNDANVATYIWETAVAPQLGYAFSLNHSLPYSFVGIQSIYLAARFNPIYWNTACLIVNSGATDETAGKSTDYGKIAKAIGDIMSSGIQVSLANINKSDFGFKPDVENNQILYGLKGLLNVGDDLISEIIAKRPYKSIRDFMNKVNVKKQSMISLIKAGAFDEMMDRKICMGWYIWETCDKKKNLTLQNMPGLTRYGLLPTDTEERRTASRIYEFNRYLKAVCKHSKEEYKLDTRAIDFLCEMGYEDLINDNMLNAKQWDKKYQTWMDIFRNWIAGDKANILHQLNSIIFKEAWDKYAKGNISAWEMEAMCFYYHEHELAHLNNDKYGFKDFFNLPEEPIVERSFYKGGKTINIFELCKICGTCIAKDKTKSTVTLLTTTGVVTVKFNKEYFSMFDKQISQKNADGTKSIKEKSWFNRGNMIVVNGMRNGDNFVAKKYAADSGHTLYRISSIDNNGNLELQIERYKGIAEDSDD